MKALTIWITYHAEEQIQKYGLAENDIFRLFKGNNTKVNGDSINRLNRFYSEIVTLYWVWKNESRSKLVGFCHYRRKFTSVVDVVPKTCQVMQVMHLGQTIAQQYKASHNYQDLCDVMEILDEMYGAGNRYTNYLQTAHMFVPYCCFIMCYEDFEKLCEFLFPILFAYDRKNHLDMNPEKYRQKAERDFRYDNVDYQQRAISFLAERLISAYLVLNMNLVSVQEYSRQEQDEN